VGDPPRWPRDTPLSTKVGTKFRRKVAVDQSVLFACGLKAVEFPYTANRKTGLWTEWEQVLPEFSLRLMSCRIKFWFHNWRFEIYELWHFSKYLYFLRSVRRLLVTESVVPSSPILVTLMEEALSSSETSVLTRATRRIIPADAILNSRRRENLKSYIALTGWTL
jgi:hypothetical protein